MLLRNCKGCEEVCEIEEGKELRKEILSEENSPWNLFGSGVVSDFECDLS